MGEEVGVVRMGLGVCLTVVALSIGGSASAQVPAPSPAPPAAAPDDPARLSVREGMKRYELGQFAEALKLFQRAYSIRANPNWLFNIAQAHRELGNLADAVRAYEQYLIKGKEVPEREREELEATIADLKKQLEKQREKQAVLPRPLPVAASVVVDDRPTAPPRRPWYRRWYVWTAIGAAVVGGTVTALAVTQSARSNVPGSVFGNAGYGGR